jgi:hypothetical protein
MGAMASEVTFFEDPPSVRTRAEVVAEVLRARASGEFVALLGVGEASPFHEAVQAARTHRDVRVVRSGAAAGARR